MPQPGVMDSAGTARIGAINKERAPARGIIEECIVDDEDENEV